MVETMVERMARSMCEADGLDWSKQSDPLQNGSGADDRAYYLGNAIAALKAMRDPTESMKLAASLVGSDDFTYAENDLLVWQAMIDQAIKEGESHES